MKSKKNETIVGLDIGSYSIKCVEVVRDGENFELSRAVLSPLAAGTDIRQALKKLELSPTSRTRVALSGSSVIIRRISMPLLSARELQSAIRFEAESHIPFSIDDCVLDYQVLKQDPVKREMSVLLVAAKKELVDLRYQLLKDVEINPEVIDLDIFCLVNAFSVLNQDHEEKVAGLLNIGHRVSSFAILDGGLPVFVREIASGGYGITKVLSETKGLGEAAADELKILRPSGEEATLRMATQKGFESLYEEIRHSIDYVENETKEDLKKIYVSGGGARAVGALEVLAAEIGRPVSFWDNIQGLKLKPGVDARMVQEHSMEFTVALGLTLRGLGVSRK